MKKKFKSQPKLKVEGIKITKKSTIKGNKAQAKRMAKEIKKFKKSKPGDGTNPFFQWSGDTNKATGKRYKTKKSKATLTYEKRFGNKKK